MCWFVSGGFGWHGVTLPWFWSWPFPLQQKCLSDSPAPSERTFTGDFRRVDISGYLACEMEEVIDGHAGNQTIERHPVFAHVVIPDTTDAEVLIRPK